MFCYKCGATMPDLSTACPQCGTAVQSAPQAAPARVAAPTPGSPVASSPWPNVPPAQPYVAEQETEGKAVGSLVLGILSLVGLWLLAGIPAIILGHLAKSSISKSMGRLKGEGMATAGLIMGYISVAAMPVVLIIAAIAIPNLIRARMVAHESSALSAMRILSTEQVVYSAAYPGKGYASSLAVLGAGENQVDCSNHANATVDHACLIDSTLGCAASWCIKNGYRYRLTAICDAGLCSDFVITATPVSEEVGMKSYCTTSDAVIRSQRGNALTRALATPTECQSWDPI